MWTILAAGLSLVGLVLGATATNADVRPLLGVAVATFAVATTSVAIGMMVSALCKSRSQATAWCVVIWFFFGIGADLLLIALVPALDLGPAGVFAALVGQPGRVRAHTRSPRHRPAAQRPGPFGAFLSWEVGPLWAATLLTATLVLWGGLSLGLAHLSIRRADL